LAFAAAAPLLAPLGAHAQAQGAKPDAAEAATVGEVVVTAQFRAQNLQNTPLAITAESAAMMEARSQTSVVDIAKQAPNVTIEPAPQGFGNSAIFSIRGITQTDFNFAMEPGVGTYIDDVYYSTVFGSLFDLLDLDRVEILRGPQGTLAGQNSIGGAVKLYSKKPDASQGGYVEATTGSLGRLDMRAGADIVLAPDKLFLRVSGISERRSGYVTRYDYACTHPGSGYPSYSSTTNCELGKEGGIDEKALRAALR
jgi:iron complex outermembrane receptor protein